MEERLRSFDCAYRIPARDRIRIFNADLRSGLLWIYQIKKGFVSLWKWNFAILGQIVILALGHRSSSYIF